MTIDEISDNFSLLDEWDDRYRYIIELGRTLVPLPAEAHTDANKVQGCASQVWLTTSVRPDGSGGPILTFRGDSDAHIVRGLIAILFALYSDKAAREHLTPQRSNGLKSVVARIRAEAETAARRSSRLFSTTNLNPGTETQHLRAFSNATKVRPSKLG
jgi:cysteine desulfuration protein SufE